MCLDYISLKRLQRMMGKKHLLISGILQNIVNSRRELEEYMQMYPDQEKLDPNLLNDLGDIILRMIELMNSGEVKTHIEW